MGSFGGGGGDAPSHQTTTTKIELPEYAQPAAKSLLKRGEELSNQPYNPYTGPRIAGLAPEHDAALSAITNRAIQGSPINNAAAGNMVDTLQGNYMSPESNPWLSGTFDAAADRITDAYSRGTAAQTDAAHSMGNTYGGSAYREQTEANQRALGDSLGQLANQTYMTNYGRERQNQMGAMQMSPQMANLDYQDAQALMGVGDIRRQFGQDILNADMGQFYEAQNYPYQQLNTLANSISGSVGGGGTTTMQTPNPYQPSPLGGMLGGGMLGASMFPDSRMLGGIGGALLGGLI